MGQDILIRQEKRPCQINYLDEPPVPALFHQWGLDADGETCAVCEVADGKCKLIPVDILQFLDKESEGWAHFSRGEE